MHFTTTALTGVTLLNAPLAAHRFDKHVHDTYAFGVTLHGVQTFTCRGSLYANTPGRVIAFNPDEAHDGAPGCDDGFAYRIVYVEPEVLRALTLHHTLPHFKTASVHAPDLANQFLNAIGATQPQECLREETLLRHFLMKVTAQHGLTDTRWATPPCDVRAQRVRDYLQTHYASNISITELANITGVSRVHVNRIFSRAFGIAPHAYLNAVRILRAKRLIQQGESLSNAALEAGFADQSHMSRRFLAAVGVSPRHYQRSFRA